MREYKYYIIYSNGHSYNEDSANNWINKQLKHNPHKITLLEQGTDLYKCEANNKAKLISLYGNINIIEDNFTPIKQEPKIVFTRFGDFNIDYILGCPYKDYMLIPINDRQIEIRTKYSNDNSKLRHMINWIKYFDYKMEVIS